MSIARPTVIWTGTLALLIFLIVLLHDILLPFVAGIALAYLLEPVVERLEKIGLNRALAAVGIVSLFIVGIGALLVVITPLLATEIAAFIEKVPDYIGRLQAFANSPSRPWLRKLIGEGLNQAQHSAGEIASLAAGWIPDFLSSVWSNTQAVFSLLSLMIVTPIVTIYLLIDWKQLIVTLDKLIPAPHRETMRMLAKEVNETIAGFLRGQGSICLILALYYALALWLVGLNHGILIGLAAGLVSFIPYLGSFSGLAVSLCVAVLQFWPDWRMTLAVLAIFVTGQAIADYVLSPYFIASRVQLNPVWVMFAIAAFGYLFGFVGLLIAVPLAASIGVIIRFAAHHHYFDLPQQPEAPPAPAQVLAPPRKNWLAKMLGR
ncbi:MAG TPA: AI-2E family transporter [Methylocella sp.]|nr:AI-2E family transporter [Methylocella sp.]